MFKMNEYRCYNCNNILCKATEGLDIEVICPKCRRINYPARKRVGIGLSGKDFNAKSINNNCPQCKRLLLKTIGFGYIELKCCNKKCNWTGVQDTLKIREKVSNMTKVAIDKLREKMNTFIIEDKPVAKVEAKETAPSVDNNIQKDVNLGENNDKVVDNKVSDSKEKPEEIMPDKDKLVVKDVSKRK